MTAVETLNASLKGIGQTPIPTHFVRALQYTPEESAALAVTMQEHVASMRSAAAKAGFFALILKL